MADSRKPFDRILIIHDRLRARTASKEELMWACHASERTLKGDLAYLRETLKAPIVFDRRGNGWRYTEPYDIGPHLGVTNEQLNRLRLSLEIVQQLEGRKASQEDKAAAVRQMLGAADNPYAKYLYFEQVPYYRGAELVGFFLQAIHERKAVRLDYEPYREPGLRRRILYPYVLKERKNRWYVIGRLPEFNGALVTYALDRIKDNDDLRILDEETFEPDPAFDVEAHFRHTYGMTVLDEPVRTVRLEFTSLSAKYFTSKPFFPYETIAEDEEKLIVEMRLIPNWELINKIVSLGDGVKVLAPDSLVRAVREALAAALARYDADSSYDFES